MAVLFNNQSCYSLLESSLRINDLISFAKEHNYKAIGICENRNLFSVMPFYHGCLANHIKPIVGIRAEVEINEKKYAYLIIAKNNNGFKSLIKLSSYLCSENKYLQFKQLQNETEDCYIINDADESYIYSSIANNDIEAIRKYLSFVLQKSDWFIGIGSNLNKYNRFNNEKLLEIEPAITKKIIAVENARYATIEDYEATKALLAIKENKTLDDHSLVLSSQAYLKQYDELKDLYSDFALANTDKICEDINIRLEDIKTELPQYQIKNDISPSSYLSELAMTGLKYRKGNRIANTYIKRLNYELEIINKMGFHNYFLIIYDIIKNARKKGIYIGPGRGSVVGSLVSYCLGITHVDPIANGLLFERFLNPERITMPDIDIDIPDNRRGEVINYVREKYGKDYVANIIAFDSLKAKAVVRDVAKILKLSERDLELITSKLVDSNTSLKDVYQNNSLFRQTVEANPAVTHLYEISIKLEGLPKNTTMHAAGIVLSKNPLTDIVPLYKNNDIYMTQYTKDYLEESGLIKFDLLGVRNLNIIDYIANSIQPKIDVLKLPLDDKATYELLRKADTNGIFQLEQIEAKKTLADIHPVQFDDIVLAMALIRPGAKGSIPEFLENKKHPENIRYIDPSLKDILEPTYGIIVYQEQIMQLAVKVAGFTLGKADILRKAISKKNSNEISKLKDQFIEGGINNGYKVEILEKIYDNIYRFGEYGFNKSHAIAYALIVYQQAYLKANYPLNFYCESLNLITGNSLKVNTFIKEMGLKGIKILPPDINQSYESFTIENTSIRYPLSSIKDISNTTAKKIIEGRSRLGTVDSLIGYYYFADQLKLTDKEVTALIRSGCLDSLNISRATLIQNESVVKGFLPIGMIEKDGIEVIDYHSPYLPIITKYVDNKDDLMNDEFEYLGLYLNGHPASKYKKQFANALFSYQVTNRLGQIDFVGMISTIKKITTRKNESMAFISINDEYGTVEFALMPKLFNNYINEIKKNDIVYVKGKRTDRNSVIINSIEKLK